MLPDIRSIDSFMTNHQVRPMTFRPKFLLYNKEYPVDFDVWLDSLQMNLQRPYVWNHSQQNELIWSMLMNRFIPEICILNKCSDDYTNIYQVIDGKQRLMTIKKFFDGEFPIIYNDEKYFFNDLPRDYQSKLETYSIKCQELVENHPNEYSDKTRIDWFKFVNFAGTPQEQEHIDKLSKEIAL